MIEENRMMNSYFDDVGDFHRKFGLPSHPLTAPGNLTADLLRFRGAFLLEELGEFFQAGGYPEIGTSLKAMTTALRVYDGETRGQDLEGAADALADLVYVALGTAHMMGLPFDEVWAEVQRANMAKERASSENDSRSKRRHASDVVKPEGWTAPDHAPAILNAVMAHRILEEDEREERAAHGQFGVGA